MKKGKHTSEQALEKIFEIYWREELREAEEEIKKEEIKFLPQLENEVYREKHH